MDKLLRPGRLDADPSSSTAEKDWLHWNRTFENFISVLPAEGLNKLQVLTNYVSPRIFEYIEHCDSYANAITRVRNRIPDASKYGQLYLDDGTSPAHNFYTRT